MGKKELESDPIAGTLGKLMDAVFIDRDDTESAVAALKQVEDLTRKGLSIVIAPEGTRLDTTTVGPFKKGPFRLAMAAGIPIVPVVIRNAEAIGSRDSTLMNPGTVDVAVFPPISVQDWTVDDLGDRIAGIRQLYLDTLADWPVEELPSVQPYLLPAGEKPKKAAKKAARKAPAKKAAKKAPVKKVAAEKAPAEKVAAKKTAAKKAPKKAPVKKTGPVVAEADDTGQGQP